MHILVLGIILLIISFALGSQWSITHIGTHPTLQFWSFWLGVACIVIFFILCILVVVGVITLAVLGLHS